MTARRGRGEVGERRGATGGGEGASSAWGGCGEGEGDGEAVGDKGLGQGKCSPTHRPRGSASRTANASNTCEGILVPGLSASTRRMARRVSRVRTWWRRYSWVGLGLSPPMTSITGSTSLEHMQDRAGGTGSAAAAHRRITCEQRPTSNGQRCQKRDTSSKWSTVQSYAHTEPPALRAMHT